MTARTLPAPQPPRAVDEASRARLRLVLLLLLVGAWFLRWTEAQTATGVALQTGPHVTGAVAAAALLALWGPAVGALLAASRRGLRGAEAATGALLAALAAALLGGGHPWLPGGALGGVLALPFVPLALLGILDASLLARPGGGDDLVAALRAGAALVVAVLLGLRHAAWPAALALWLALAPALLLGRGAALRRRLHVLFLLGALVLFLAPELNAALGGAEEAAGTYEGRFAWQVLAAALVLLALDGLARPGRPVGTPA